MAEGSKGNIFIDRPVLACVISIVMVLVGVLAILTLPVAQFPQIAPPSVSVSATYPGAYAQVVEESVATPVEQEINGAQDMLYMSSTNANDGSMSLTATFEVGRDLDLAAVDVQNRANLATSKLPDDVKKEGLEIEKKSPDIVMVLSLISPDATFDALFLSNYASINLLDTIKRIPGVGSVMLVGSGDYGMRIWVDPDKLQRLGLSASDLYAAITEQNVQAPAGQLGQAPAPPGTQLQLPVRVKGRLDSAEEFGNIIIVAKEDGTVVRVKDVASVELGSQNYAMYGSLDKKNSAHMVIYQLPTANALEVAKQVESTMADMAKRFPAGLSYTIPYDATKFVTVSIKEVVITLIEAIVLVFIVVFIFLQNWRATIIPLLAVPVSLVGTFALFGPLGFSINTLTLFGLVLAIGIVVDDAIVVVEAAVHEIEKGLSPKEATRKAMRQITGPVIATTFAMCSVFIPVAFMTGLTGVLYQQFALTLAASVVISSINALSLSPALCGLLLRPSSKTPTRGPLGWFFRHFNRVFERTTSGYVKVATLFTRKLLLAGIVLLAGYAGAGSLASILPTGFVPEEDEGMFFAELALPAGASQQRTQVVLEQVEDIIMKLDGVEHIISFGSFSFSSGVGASNVASVIVTLKDWDQRKAKALHLPQVVAKAQQALSGIMEARVFTFVKPAIPGVGSVGGVQFLLQDASGGSVEDLSKQADAFIAECRKDPSMAAVFTSFSVDTPQIEALVDREKAKTMGVAINDIFLTMQVFLGGAYVNDFNMFGKTYRVMLQARPDFRVNPEDIGRFHVKSRDGQMVPLSTLVDTKNIAGPQFIKRHNLFRTVEINIVPAQGVSSGEVIEKLKNIAANTLPRDYAYDWGGTAYQQVKTEGQAVFIFALAVLFCFLVLAAQYESWSLPFAVMLSVPLAALGAFTGLFLHALDLNVYAQIGLIMLVGLAAKNAILIVEYAADLHKTGLSILESAKEAAELRFRPLLMTAFSFILGMLPLVLATGAGANSRVALGTCVVAGMFVATVCGVFVVPALFVGVSRLSGAKEISPSGPPPAGGAPASTPATGPAAGATPQAGEPAAPTAPDDAPQASAQAPAPPAGKSGK